MNTETLKIDYKKSLADNLKEKLPQWEEIQGQIETKKKQLKFWKEELTHLIPQNVNDRLQMANIRNQMELAEREIYALSRKSDSITFLCCMAKVVRETNTTNTCNQEIPILNSIEGKNEKTILSVVGPIRTRIKRKKSNKPASGNKTTLVSTKTIENYISSNSQSIELEQSRKFAHLTGELLLDVQEFEHCPSCQPQKVQLEYIDRHPSLVCPRCGLSKDTLDVTSSLVFDKVQTVHIPFTYRPKQHFISWIKRITGDLNYPVEPAVLDTIYIELNNRRITDVNHVTWEVVDSILRKLAKTSDKKMNEYYQHVYQITNIIRGEPILVLSEAEKEKLYEMFDIIYTGWERYKTDERCNFMSNGFVLQMCFRILNYPEQVINMFNTMKGTENVKEYDRICELICKDNDWPIVSSSSLSDLKYTSGKNLSQYFIKRKLDSSPEDLPNSKKLCVSQK